MTTATKDFTLLSSATATGESAAVNLFRNNRVQISPVAEVDCTLTLVIWGLAPGGTVAAGPWKQLHSESYSAETDPDEILIEAIYEAVKAEVTAYTSGTLSVTGRAWRE